MQNVVRCHLCSVFFFQFWPMLFFSPVGGLANGDFCAAGAIFCAKMIKMIQKWYCDVSFHWSLFGSRATFSFLNWSRPRQIWCRSMARFSQRDFSPIGCFGERDFFKLNGEFPALNGKKNHCLCSRSLTKAEKQLADREDELQKALERVGWTFDLHREMPST